MPTLVDQQSSVGAGPFSLVDAGTYSHMAQGYTPSKSFSVVQIELSLIKVGTIAGTVRVSIRQVSGGNPGTSITNGDSDTINVSAISTSQSWIPFAFSTPCAVTGSTLYYLEITHAGGTFDGSNYVAWYLAGGSPYAGGIFKFQVNSGGWNQDTDPDMGFRTYEADGPVGGFFFMSS